MIRLDRTLPPAGSAGRRPQSARRCSGSSSFLLPFAIGAVAGTVYTLARITTDDRVIAAIIAALVLVLLAPLFATPALRG